MVTDREGWLAEAVIELVDVDIAAFDEATYAYGLALRMAELVGPAEVGVLLCGAGKREAVATGSSERASGLAFLQARGMPGPATDACRTGHAGTGRGGREQRNRDCGLHALAVRWPRFTDAAAAAGFGTARTVVMSCHDETIGAIMMLGAPAWTLVADDAGLTELLAEVAAITVARQRALALSQRTTRQLQRALDSRVVIEQAKGAAAAWLGITPAEAFELLRGYSRRASRPLQEVAANVVRGTLPVGDLAVPSRRRLRP